MKKILLRVDKITVLSDGREPTVKNVSFTIHEGEIFGIAGVAGNGQRELVESIMSIRPPIKGRIFFMNQDITNLPTKDKLLKGIAYIPEDRIKDGILPSLNVAENLVLGAHHVLSRRIILDWDSIFTKAKRL